jgi:steroid delta-isomerase-like uncharacterized protein
MDSEALVRRYYDAFNAGDPEGMLACLDEHVRHEVNQGPTRAGKGAFAEFLAHMARCYEERLEDLVTMQTPNGASAAATFTVHGRYIATDEGLPAARGQRYELPAGAFFSIEGGRIARIATCYNLPDWIRQVSA